MMRVSSSLVLSTLCLIASPVWASPAHFYTYDPQPVPNKLLPRRTDLSTVAARLVIAQRAGVEKYHNAHLRQDDVIQAINDFGVRTPLFADAKNEPAMAFILLEGDEYTTALTPAVQPYSAFELGPGAGRTPARDLFVDLVRQSDPQRFLAHSDSDLFALLRTNITQLSNGNTFHVAQSPAELEQQFSNLVASKEWRVTAIVTTSGREDPSTPAVGAHHAAPWGTYEMPGAQSPLKPKQKRQQTGVEAPLSASIPGTNAGAFADGDDGNDNDDPPPAQPTSSPLRGILPACYTSQQECERTTRGCMGHGSCALKYRDDSESGGDSAASGRSCYACVCGNSTSADGRRTTYWAGPACQKQDVSVQFWLLALFTVALVGLVSFAVGSVWEMGAEPLPSVIGAGVSGTGARK